ncbi:hypothetical protein [Sporisorium scitamineum]|uniref:DUF3752 domain-containing protein n=1 Tax=Sporisorium scitamineum TaxID=49012 RepID=A0A0F7S911_9BASI|nr:hypothetical protein [Sporisorium scitamineum]
MATIGPQLPPKEERSSSRRSRSRSASGLARSPYASSSRSPSPSGSDVSFRQQARRPVAGPQLPADFIRSRSGSGSGSRSRSQRLSSDDEQGPSVGPALPIDTMTRNDGISDGAKLFLEREARRKAAEDEAKLAAEKAANSRPEWMLLPPSFSNASSLQAVAGDPLNLKSRGFAQTTPRVSARGGGGAKAEDADTSVWTETPEERLKRMQDQVSGVKAHDASAMSDREALERERSAKRDSSIAAAVAARHDSDRHSHRRRHRSRSRSPEARDRHGSSSSSHRHHRSSRRDDSHREGEKNRIREEEEVRSGKAAAPMIWDRDAALSFGGRLMDEKKRGKMMADANALGDRFGSGSRRFL